MKYELLPNALGLFLTIWEGMKTGEYAPGFDHIQPSWLVIMKPYGVQITAPKFERGAGSVTAAAAGIVEQSPIASSAYAGETKPYQNSKAVIVFKISGAKAV